MHDRKVVDLPVTQADRLVGIVAEIYMLKDCIKLLEDKR